MLRRPRWVNFGRADPHELRFVWDDARVDDDFTGDAAAVLSAALKISARARMVLAIGLYEWVVWRFDGLHAREEPRQVLEAAWCATVDPRYFNFYELTRDEWVGPIEGPLWCAMAYLQHGLPKGYALEGDLYDTLEFLYLLATHVAADPDALERWLRPTLERLVEGYPMRPENEFEDLFEHHIGEHLGALIGRDVLDPTLAVDLERDRNFLSELLVQVSANETAFLASPDDLEERGFAGKPYVLPS